jgi:hypothetical protein
MDEAQPQGKKRELSSERARELARMAWAAYPTAESRRIRTLRCRIATGAAAQKELDALLDKVAREAGTRRGEV